jgi:hypothetical protein
MRNTDYRQTQQARALCFSPLFRVIHDCERKQVPTGFKQPRFPTQLPQQTRNRRNLSNHNAKQNNRDFMGISRPQELGAVDFLSPRQK